MRAVTIEAGDEECSIITPNFRVRFRLAGDRWVHLVERPVGGVWRRFAEPLQGADLGEGRARVINPIYQEVHTQRTAQGDRLLAIGRWGKHHFSAVFSIVSDETQSALEVDVADRCRESFAPLACTYRVSALPGELAGASRTHAVWDLPEGRWRLDAEPPNSLVLAELGRIGISAQVMAGMDRASFTQRCHYRLAFQPADSPA